MSTKSSTRNAGSARARASAANAAPGNGQTTLSWDEVTRMIAEAAYFRAAQRGFEPGHEMSDWLAAEREILEGLEACPTGRRPDGAAPGQESRHRGVLVETPPADATAR